MRNTLLIIKARAQLTICTARWRVVSRRWSSIASKLSWKSAHFSWSYQIHREKSHQFWQRYVDEENNLNCICNGWCINKWTDHTQSFTEIAIKIDFCEMCVLMWYLMISKLIYWNEFFSPCKFEVGLWIRWVQCTKQYRCWKWTRPVTFSNFDRRLVSIMLQLISSFELFLVKN